VILNFAEGTHPGTEQRDARPPIHCALERFWPIDLPFSLAVAPRLDHGVADRLYVDHQCPSEIHDCHRPALAKEFMHAGKQPLKALQPVGAIEVRPICPVLPLLSRANWPLPLTAQMLLDPVAQVLHQVKAVGDLPRLWSALTRCVGVETITIRGDQLDAGSLGQPRRSADSRAIGQAVDHFSTLKVDRDRAEAKALS